MIASIVLQIKKQFMAWMNLTKQEIDANNNNVNDCIFICITTTKKRPKMVLYAFKRVNSLSFWTKYRM